MRFSTPHITWQSHAFLNAARDKTMWERIKALARDNGGTVRLEVLKNPLPRASSLPWAYNGGGGAA